MSIFSAVTVNWLLWFLASPAAKVNAASLSSCPNDISTLYSMDNATVSNALNNYFANLTDYCNVEVSSEVCTIGIPGINLSAPFPDLLGGALQGLDVEGMFNFTAFSYENMPTHDAYMKSCKAADTAKFCQLGAQVHGSGVFIFVPFSLHQEIVGLPVCIPTSCSEADLVGLANQMSPNVTSLFSGIPGVTIDALNLTSLTVSMCE
jgi:hypothetical protein